MKVSLSAGIDSNGSAIKVLNGPLLRAIKQEEEKEEDINDLIFLTSIFACFSIVLKDLKVSLLLT